MTKIITSADEYGRINSFDNTGVRSGDRAFDRGRLLAVRVNPSATAAVYAGDPLKVISSSGSMITVDRATTAGDLIAGVAATNIKNGKGTFAAGELIEMFVVGDAFYGEAGAAISGGAKLNAVVVSDGNCTYAPVGTSKGSFVGLALDTAAKGDAVRVLLMQPIAFEANADS